MLQKEKKTIVAYISMTVSQHLVPSHYTLLRFIRDDLGPAAYHQLLLGLVGWPDRIWISLFPRRRQSTSRRVDYPKSSVIIAIVTKKLSKCFQVFFNIGFKINRVAEWLADDAPTDIRMQILLCALTQPSLCRIWLWPIVFYLSLLYWYNIGFPSNLWVCFNTL